MPHAMDPDLLFNDDEVRESMMRFNRERNSKRLVAVAVMLAALAAGVLFTYLTYSPL